MKRLARIAGCLPFALLLSLVVTIQALITSQHAHSAGHAFLGELQSVIVCADGELLQITVDANGDPVSDGGGGGPICQLCTASGKLFIHPPAQKSHLVELTAGDVVFAIFRSEKHVSRQPDRFDCLGPPLIF